ncbi:3-hydroxyacyl-[acyl-carrier-protein] dehydratase FabZ [Fibrobacterales bacterium]|nr:3-hydroxyacyl-[acyl-carrier-protein] dehydratase FabZ [Fibrobacterales bacterium]
MLIDQLPKPQAKDCLLDYAAILQLLPHRFPFLLIDRVISFDPNAEKAKLVALKNVSFNEPYFAGHFPNDPVMPGVLQAEAMAQAGCILAYLKFEEESKGKRPAFMGIDACKFRRAVRPGDTLRIEVELEEFRRGIITFDGKIFVGEDKVAEAKLKATMV